MPLFNYACVNCAHEFEALSRFDETPACPACGAARAQRQLAHIAKPLTQSDPEPSCQRSGGEACQGCPALAGAF
ncbi:MAG: zinc ribbon domain-containing protein [Methylocystaceae bacterium]|nr:zinc ribbon domain-containing protein [Methylocystaceae bacterium]NBT96228.1 zinc ribbon domain-containing protein [Methylocystaceae bacterium]